MLSAGHSQRERVRRLLEAASSAMGGSEPFDGEVEVDVMVTAPKGHQVPDATNMLGGLGDVLQARATGADVEHLGPLGRVACFPDDAQISSSTIDAWKARASATAL